MSHKPNLLIYDVVSHRTIAFFVKIQRKKAFVNLKGFKFDISSPVGTLLYDRRQIRSVKNVEIYFPDAIARQKICKHWCTLQKGDVEIRSLMR